MSASGLPGFGGSLMTSDLVLTPKAAGIVAGVTILTLVGLFVMRVIHFFAWRGMWNPEELWPEVIVHCTAYLLAAIQVLVCISPAQDANLRISQVFFMAALAASQITQVLLYRRVFGWATRKLWKNFNILFITTVVSTVIPVVIAGLGSIQAAIGLALMCFSVLTESAVASIGPACFLVWMLDKPAPSFDEDAEYADPKARHATIRLDLFRLIAPILVCFWVIQFLENDGSPSIATLVIQQVIVVVSFISIPPFVPLMIYRMYKDRTRRSHFRNRPVQSMTLSSFQTHTDDTEHGKSNNTSPTDANGTQSDKRRDSHEEQNQISFEAFLASGP